MKKKKNNILVVFFIILLFITFYLILRTSYMIKYDNLNINNLSEVFIKRLSPIPFELCFETKAFIWLFLPALIYALYLKEKYKPKADTQWKDIEHGSNNWQTNEELEKFKAQKTDPIVLIDEEELNNIKKRCEEMLNVNK